MGVLASRSTHRPNSIGMSVVKNNGLVQDKDKVHLLVEGVDLVDGTPLIDIKPYIGYADSVPNASDKLDDISPIPQRHVEFLDTLRPTLPEIDKRHSGFTSLVTTVLAQDPRPAYKQKLDNDEKTYRVTLYDIDVGFKVIDSVVWVTELVHLG